MKTVLTLGILGVVLLLGEIIPSASGLKCVVCGSYESKAREAALGREDCATYQKGDSKYEPECPLELSTSCAWTKAESSTEKLVAAECSNKDAGAGTRCEKGKFAETDTPMTVCYCGDELCNDPSKPLVPSPSSPSGPSSSGTNNGESSQLKNEDESKSSTLIGPSFGVLIVWLGGVAVGGIIMERLF